MLYTTCPIGTGGMSQPSQHVEALKRAGLEALAAVVCFVVVVVVVAVVVVVGGGGGGGGVDVGVGVEAESRRETRRPAKSKMYNDVQGLMNRYHTR